MVLLHVAAVTFPPISNVKKLEPIDVHTVKSCIKAAAYVHFFDFPGRLLHETGL